MSEFRVNGDMFGRYVTILTGFDKQQHVYKVCLLYTSSGSGGYLALREADTVNNDLNREEIAAVKQIYGTAYLVEVNYFDQKRERILAGEESIFDEVTGAPIYNFSGSFCVPVKDPELERMILAWNGDDLSLIHIFRGR